MANSNRESRTTNIAISAQQRVQTSLRIRGPLPRLLTWLYDVLFGAIIVGGIFYFFAAFGEGGSFFDRLGDVYQTIIDFTTDGTPWTQIMQDNRLYLLVPGTLVMLLLGWILPRDYTGRATLLFSVLAIGFLAGHVFW